MDGYTVDQSSQFAMQRFAPLSSIIAFCACILCLDGLYAAMLVFGLACAGQAVALSLIHHSGGSMTALLIVIPPLVQVLAISSGVHFVNYYRTATRHHGAIGGVGEALRLGAVPCILSAATTAIGLGSLAVSGLSAVREFGVYAAIGVTANVVLLMAFLPGLLVLPHQWARRKSARTAPHDLHSSPIATNFAGRRMWWNWNDLTRFQQRFGSATGLAAVAVMIGLGLGTMQLEASVRIETLFANDNRLIEDYRWIEEHVGAMVPIETVVHFAPDCRLDAVDRITILRNLEQRLHDTPSIRAVTSCVSFFPLELVAADASMAPLILDEVKPWLKRVDYFSQDESGEHWRLTAHFSAVETIHYGDLLQDLEHSLSQEEVLRQNDSGASLELSGLMPLVHGIQTQLLQDLFASFMIAFLLIALVMTIAEAGIVAGLISMLPNVFPTFTLFGILGWIGASVDIGSIMTASVAMGIAVDDTLHFLSVFRRQLDLGESRFHAVQTAYAECGRAMIQTTLICGSGLAIFALSDFVPTARFAWMMVALLAAALFGDLIVLPALLLSPLGKVFELSRPMTCRRRGYVVDGTGKISDLVEVTLPPSARLHRQASKT